MYVHIHVRGGTKYQKWFLGMKWRRGLTVWLRREVMEVTVIPTEVTVTRTDSPLALPARRNANLHESRSHVHEYMDTDAHTVAFAEYRLFYRSHLQKRPIKKDVSGTWYTASTCAYMQIYSHRYTVNICILAYTPGLHPCTSLACIICVALALTVSLARSLSPSLSCLLPLSHFPSLFLSIFLSLFLSLFSHS